MQCLVLDFLEDVNKCQIYNENVLLNLLFESCVFVACYCLGLFAEKASKEASKKEAPNPVFEKRKAKIKELIGGDGPQPVPPPPTHSPPPLPPVDGVPPPPYSPPPEAPPPLPPVSRPEEDHLQEQAFSAWDTNQPQSSQRAWGEQRYSPEYDPHQEQNSPPDYEHEVSTRDPLRNRYREEKTQSMMAPPPAMPAFKPLAPPPMPPRPVLLSAPSLPPPSRKCLPRCVATCYVVQDAQVIPCGIVFL